MTRRASIGLVLALGGCGRLGFEAGVDAPVVDEAVDAPAAPLCDRVQGALYCNDFDTPDLLGATRLGQTVARGVGRAGDGAWTMTAAPDAQPRLQVRMASVDAGALHLGGVMKIDGTGDVAEFVVLAQALSPQFVKVSLDGVSGDRAQVANLNVGNARQGAAGTLPRDRWFCYEVVIAVDAPGGGGSIQLRIDDAEVLSSWQGQATRPVGGYTSFEIGAIAGSDNTAPLTVHHDSWIIASQPIGCP